MGLQELMCWRVYNTSYGVSAYSLNVKVDFYPNLCVLGKETGVFAIKGLWLKYSFHRDLEKALM